MASRFVITDGPTDEVAQIVRQATNKKRISSIQDAYCITITLEKDCAVVLMLLVYTDEV